jgi:hypothetical protein
MRGLPPLPTDMLTLEVEWAINNGRCTTGWHIWNPGSGAANVSDLATFVGQWFLFALPELLPLLGTDCSASTCRLSTVGSSHLIYRQLLAPNVGGLGTTNPLNGSLCLTWRGAERGLSGRSHTLLPLADTLVDDDHKSLRQISWAFAVSQAQRYLDAINAIVAVDGALCVAAIVHRSRNGAPTPISEWEPVLSADASQRVGTIARRTRSARPLPPF